MAQSGSLTLSLKHQVKNHFPKPWRRIAKAYYSFRVRTLRPRWHLRKTHWGLELVRNLLIDLRFGGYCGGRIPTRFESTGAHGFTSADYYQLAKLFNPDRGVPIGANEVLVDVGCGKGRVINFWLSQGVTGEVVGLELDPEIAEHARTRLRRFSNVRIITGDAVENLPENGTLFFLFNPFGPNVIEAFKNRFYERFANKSNVRILYYYCKYLDLFRDDDRFRVEELPFKAFYSAAVIKPVPCPRAPSATAGQIAI